MEDRLHYLIKRYLDNNCSREELEDFFTYIRNAGHDDVLRQKIRAVYKELRSEDGDTSRVDEKGRLVFTEPEWLKEIQTHPAKKRSALLAPLSMATGLVAIICLLWLVKAKSPVPTKNAMIASLTKKTTDRSESKFLLLEDSTQVWLNAASSLEFPDQFDPRQREVILTGEAYFDVKHTDKIPFIIHTGDVSTTVLGTSFNIKAYPGQKNITISVNKGKVKVSTKNGWLTTLTGGQELKLNEINNAVKEKTIPTDGSAAWQQGNIVFDDETLNDIVADMERIYNANIKIDNEDILDLKISTSFKKEIGIDQALQVLCRLTDCELKQADGIYVIQ